MGEEKMPFNEVGTTPVSAEREEREEAEWREKNLPRETLVFRWRYVDATIQLYERRLRSLASFNVGPAVQAWVRSRLEWMQDNKLSERPEGVLELTITPEGDVGMSMQEIAEPPAISSESLSWDGEGRLSGCSIEGSVWGVRPEGVRVWPGELRRAADTFARDLLSTLGYTLLPEPLSEDALDGGELFLVSDEFGVIPCEGREGPVGEKLASCFRKLWTPKS